MPANFDDDVGSDLTRIQRLFENPTGFGTNVRNLIGKVLEDFGTAALRDTGTSGGNLPVIGSLQRREDGRLTDSGGLGAFVGMATTENKGFVDGSLGDADSYPRQIQRLINTFQTTIGAGRVNISRPQYRISSGRNDVRFLTATNRPSIVLVGAGGSPSAASAISSPVVLLSDSNNNADTTRIHINGGGTDAPMSPDGVTALDNSAISYLSPAQLTAFKFQWGFVLRGWGAEGGVPEAGDHSAFRRERNLPPAARSEAGDLLVAFKPADTALWYEAGEGNTAAFIYYGSTASNVAGKTAFAVEIVL